MSQKRKANKATTKSAPTKIAPQAYVVRPDWRDFALMLFVFAATFLSFLPSLRNSFVGWDDSGMFLENVEYRGLSWSNIKWMFTTFHYAHYHPITWLTLGLDYKIWGMNAKGYHLTSLIIHSLNAVLFFVLAKLLLSKMHPGRAGSFLPAARRGTSGDIRGISEDGAQGTARPTGGSSPMTTVFALKLGAVVGALFWAIHPLRVESVAWATERRDVLSGLFYLLTIISYVKAQTQESRKARWLTLSVICFVLSFLSKAWGITLPVVLLVLDIYPLRRLSLDSSSVEDSKMEFRRRLNALLIEKIPFVLISVSLAIVAFIGQKKWGIEAETLTFAKKLAISAYALAFYLWKTIVPLNLSPLYLLPHDLNPFDFKYIGCGVLLLATTILLFRFRQRWPWALAAWVCYGVIVSPVIGLTHKGDQIAADRYTYLSLLPIAVLIAAAAFKASQSRLVHFSYVIFAAAIGTLSFLSFNQAKIWRDDLSLWQQALKVEPNNPIAHNGRGRIRMESGDLQGALADFNEAIRLNPKIVSARNNRGMVFYQQNDLDAALADFEAALKLQPQHEIYNNCGAIYEVRGDLKKALQNYSWSVQFKPSYAIGYFNRARVRKREGDLDGALVDFNLATKYDPLYPDAYFRRGDLYIQKNDVASAIRDYETALKVAPPNWSSRRDVEQRLTQAKAQASGRS